MEWSMVLEIPLQTPPSLSYIYYNFNDKVACSCLMRLTIVDKWQAICQCSPRVRWHMKTMPGWCWSVSALTINLQSSPGADQCHMGSNSSVDTMYFSKLTSALLLVSFLENSHSDNSSLPRSVQLWSPPAQCPEVPWIFSLKRPHYWVP